MEDNIYFFNSSEKLLSPIGKFEKVINKLDDDIQKNNEEIKVLEIYINLLKIKVKSDEEIYVNFKKSLNELLIKKSFN
jgi:hypothetical protein